MAFKELWYSNIFDRTMKAASSPKSNNSDKKAVIEVKAEKPAGSRNYFWLLINFWIFIPAIIYFKLVDKYAVNFPYMDDYNAILEFLSKFKIASFADKFFLLFSQHGDHRIFHSRVIYVIYYYLFGRINFRSIIFIGNLQLVVIFILLVLFIRKAIPKYWNLASLIVGFCIFDPSSYENADFAMCGVQNYGLIMLFLLSLFFYNKVGTKFLIAGAIFEAVCIFSSGNGLICAICLTLFLLLKKENRKAIISAAILAVCGGLYYLHYVKSDPLGGTHGGFELSRNIKFLLHMLGSHFSYESGIPIGIGVLIALLVLMPISIKNIKNISKLQVNIKENTLPFLCVLAAVLGTMFTISMFRSNLAMGELGSYSSRYLINSHLLIAILFVFLWLKFEGKKSFWYVSVVATLLLLYAYNGNYEYGERCMDMTQKRLENLPYFFGDHSPASNATAKAIEEEACRLDIYCIKDER